MWEWRWGVITWIQRDAWWWSRTGKRLRIIGKTVRESSPAINTASVSHLPNYAHKSRCLSLKFGHSSDKLSAYVYTYTSGIDTYCQQYSMDWPRVRINVHKSYVFIHGSQLYRTSGTCISTQKLLLTRDRIYDERRQSRGSVTLSTRPKHLQAPTQMERLRRGIFYMLHLANEDTGFTISLYSRKLMVLYIFR